MIRVIDGSGEDALYPVSYFEPFTINGNRVSEAITVYLDAYIKGVLHAEAVAAGKSISALVREWIEERLDLPANRDNDAQTADLVGHREA
jgi:hypothetical protein